MYTVNLVEVKFWIFTLLVGMYIGQPFCKAVWYYVSKCNAHNPWHSSFVAQINLEKFEMYMYVCLVKHENLIISDSNPLVFLNDTYTHTHTFGGGVET